MSFISFYISLYVSFRIYPRVFDQKVLKYLNPQVRVRYDWKRWAHSTQATQAFFLVVVAIIYDFNFLLAIAKSIDIKY